MQKGIQGGKFHVSLTLFSTWHLFTPQTGSWPRGSTLTTRQNETEDFEIKYFAHIFHPLNSINFLIFYFSLFVFDLCTSWADLT